MPEPGITQLAELKIPAQGEYIGIAKRVATSLGGMLGFSLDEIDELGIAVTQACGSLIEAADEAWGPGATLKLVFAPTRGGIAFEVDAIGPRAREALAVPRRAPGRSLEQEIGQALAREMIRAFVDDFRHQVDAGRRQMRYRMVKYLVS